MYISSHFYRSLGMETEVSPFLSLQRNNLNKIYSRFILGIVFAIYYNTRSALTVKKNENYNLILCDIHSLFAAFPVATGCDREKREAQERPQRSGRIQIELRNRKTKTQWRGAAAGKRRLLFKISF